MDRPPPEGERYVCLGTEAGSRISSARLGRGSKEALGRDSALSWGAVGSHREFQSQPCQQSVDPLVLHIRHLKHREGEGAPVPPSGGGHRSH